MRLLAYLDDLVSDHRARVMLWLGLIGLLLLLRLLTLGTYPLIDTTEARYGEISRVMLSSGNWITPQQWPGQPFWAKPPLYAWLSAASMALLGVHEFAVRLPSFLFALMTGLLAYLWATGASTDRTAANETGLIALLALISAPLFYVSAGAVMTDPALAFCITWMLLAFERSVLSGNRATVWRYGFFFAAGLGMLAKGPVIVVYAGLPIAALLVWQIFRRNLVATLGLIWTGLPWLTGSILFLAVCVPWYVAAELRTPGFAEYFLLGEHVMRFIKPGWQGDLYGNAHREPLGKIWLFALGAIGFWAPLLITSFVKRHLPSQAITPPTSRQWLLCCLLAPLLFFSIARNIIWTYVLPVLVPFAVLIASQVSQRLGNSNAWRRALAITALACTVLIMTVWVTLAPDYAAQRSAQVLVNRWQQAAAQQPGPLLYWGGWPSHSLRFYSSNQAKVIDPKQPFNLPSGTDYVVLASHNLPAFKQWLSPQLPCVSSLIMAQTKSLSLLKISAVKSADCPAN